jgi:hypothetical protein
MTKQMNLMEPQTGLDTDRVKEAIDSGKLAENRRKRGANLSSDSTELTNLEWRIIPFAPNYNVSEYGHIAKDGEFMRPFTNQNGYKVAQFSINRKRLRMGIHKVVALAFLGDCPDGFQVAHNDGDQLNNHYTNLRYATPKENCADKKKHDTNWIRHRRAMSSETAMLALEMVANKIPRRKIATQLGLNVGTVNGIVYGRSYTDLTGRSD